MSNSPLSFRVATTLAAYRIVGISAANTVAYPANGLVLPIGITDNDVLDTTSSIPVHGPGSIAKCFFSDTVSAAGLVAGDTAGKGTPFTLADTTTALTLANAYVGILVDATATAGAIVNVYVMPGFDRV